MGIGIYCIENKTNGKKYIGQGIHVEKRMWQYHEKCVALLNALTLYGEDNFDRYVIEYCEQDKLAEREQYYIKHFKSHVSENGYNISWGGIAPFANRTHTKETKMKIRDAGKNKVFSENHKNKISESHSGNLNPMFDRFEENSPSFGKKTENSSSKYFGVSIMKVRQYVYWQARLYINKQIKLLGTFKKEIDAAVAYDLYVIENNLPHPLNF